MFPISIDSVSGGYEISLGNLKGIILDCDFVIADSFFKSCEYLITKDVIFVEAKEENKSLKVVENIIYDLSLKGATKKSRILAMGGGSGFKHFGGISIHAWSGVELSSHYFGGHGGFLYWREKFNKHF